MLTGVRLPVGTRGIGSFGGIELPTLALLVRWSTALVGLVVYKNPSIPKVYVITKKVGVIGHRFCNWCYQFGSWCLMPRYSVLTHIPPSPCSRTSRWRTPRRRTRRP